MSFEHLLSPGVESRVDVCRGGRELVTLVHQRSGCAIYATPADVVEAASHRRRINEDASAIRSAGFVHGGRSQDPPPAPAPARSLMWKQADAFVRDLHRVALHRAFQRRWVSAQIVLGAVGAFALAVVISRDPIALRAGPADIPVILAMGLAAVFVHELGHALATVHYGRTVRSAGLRLHLGSPAFYVDSLDALLLTRRQRIIQAWAGPWAEWMVTSIALLLAASGTIHGHPNELLHRFVIINSIGIAMNLLPFVGLDGSLLLADLIREPDLSIRSREVFSRGRHSTGCGRLLRTYALANVIVGSLLVVSAAFFWWQLFGNLVGVIVSFGLIGWVALGAAGLFTGRRTVSKAIRTISYGVSHLAPAWTRLRFRMQRRWRVRAILALRTDTDLALLNEHELGVLAGHLKPISANSAAHLDDRTPCYRDRRRIAVLPEHWRGLLQASDSASA